MDILQTFEDKIEAFLREQNMARTTFGTKSLGDPNFVKDLRRGREPHFSTMQKVERWMNDYRARRAREPGLADKPAK